MEGVQLTRFYHRFTQTALKQNVLKFKVPCRNEVISQSIPHPSIPFVGWYLTIVEFHTAGHSMNRRPSP